MVTLPSIGERLLHGFLRSNNVRIPRRRLREAIQRVDPDGLQHRRSLLHRRIKRRVYSVPAPHNLWHIDGNHKLIRWSMVIHCGIDGFSRSCVYIRCANNNRSETVLHSFDNAVNLYETMPKRVRSDYGTENYGVIDRMIAANQDDSPAVLLGSSVHNQRVERFNGEINRNIRLKYAHLFYTLESRGLLDPNDELDLFTLHYVFLPRINRALATLANSHNNHCISTEFNATPNQLLAVYDHVAPSHRSDSDEDASAQLFHDTPAVLSEYYQNFLLLNVPPHTADEDNGLTVYQAVREYIHNYAFHE